MTLSQNCSDHTLLSNTVLQVPATSRTRGTGKDKDWCTQGFPSSTLPCAASQAVPLQLIMEQESTSDQRTDLQNTVKKPASSQHAVRLHEQ